MNRWVVFGTLLGPEATGPVVAALAVAVRDLCFWFPGCTDRMRLPLVGGGVWGVWYGVVV